MRILTLLMCVSSLALAEKPDLANAVVLDGEKVKVHWSDGDSFKVRSGKHKNAKTRLMGYNTLESFGPVHMWGGWSGFELYYLQKRGTYFARSRVWNCTSSGKQDHYKRLLVRCDDLVQAMVREGYGHVFEMPGGTPNAEDMKAQKEAIAASRGMWLKGVPKGIITSLHSSDEKDDGKDAYNRVADPLTGMTRKVQHSDKYGLCEKVCIDGSCMVYAPFKQRYGKNQAECLFKKKGD